MKTKYPLFFQDIGTLTAVLSDTQAFQYRDTDKASPKPKGYEFFTFTQRKTVRKLQQSGDPISHADFLELLNTAIERKRLSLLHDITHASWQAYESAPQINNA